MWHAILTSHVEILRDGGTVNAERYLTFLQNMIEQFRRELRLWQMTIQHDNARPHAAVLVQQWIASQNISLLPPDTNLMDRYIFRNFVHSDEQQTLLIHIMYCKALMNLWLISH